MGHQIDEEAEEQITSTVGPAYAVDGYATTSSTGVHCSASNDWCFFCAYQTNADAVGTDADLYGARVLVCSCAVFFFNFVFFNLQVRQLS
jgi:hypothetical protein